MQKKRKNSAKINGEIKIIAGQWRGRKLPVLNLTGLRPTTGRIKETLFNWLMPYIADSRCLDCFAGSGGLGMEALSRQASSVSFFELNKSVSKQLQINLHHLQSKNGHIQTGDSLQLLKQGNHHQSFDIIFLDPPFNQNLLQSAISLLHESQSSDIPWLAQDALIYVEKERSLSQLVIPDDWQLLKEKQIGEVSFNLYRYNREN